MTVIEIVLFIFVGYGFFLGFSKGIIKTVFTVLSYILGLMAALKFAPAMTNFLESAFNTKNPLMFIAGFLLSFVLTIILIRMLARGLEGVLQTANVNIINQLLGGALLAGFMILVYSMLLSFGDKAQMIDEDTKYKSITYEYLEKYPDIIWSLGKSLQPVFDDFWKASAEFMDKINGAVERSESEELFDIPEDDEDSY